MNDDIRAKLMQLDALSASIADVECYEPEYEPVKQQIDALVEETEATCLGFEVLQVDTAPDEYRCQMRWALVPKKEDAR